MGRQSYLARLALGRSPFQPPLQDENGDFIFGPNVQHDTGPDYVQDFNHRGHPRNIASASARRKLDRAQNEALSTVGVVVRKAKASRTRWQTMDEGDKFKLVVEENTAGTHLGIAEGILQKLSTHWILNLRRRVFTYKSYLGFSVPQLIMSDWNDVGARQFFLSGLFASSIARLSRHTRMAVAEKDAFPNPHPQTGSVLERTEFFKTLRDTCWQLLWFSLEYPFYAYSVLQALQLLPPGFSPSLLIQNVTRDLSPDEPPQSSVAAPFSLAAFWQKDIKRPFILAVLREHLSHMLFPTLHAWIRKRLVRPARPDALSFRTTSASLHIIPGRITTGTAQRLARGEGRVKGVLGKWLSNVLWLWLQVLHTQRVPLAIDLNPSTQDQLLDRSVEHMKTLLHRNPERGIMPARRYLCVQAIRAAFRDFNLNPDTSMHTIYAMADGISTEDLPDGSYGIPSRQPSPQDHHVNAEQELRGMPIDTDEDLRIILESSQLEAPAVNVDAAPLPVTDTPITDTLIDLSEPALDEPPSHTVLLLETMLEDSTRDTVPSPTTSNMPLSILPSTTESHLLDEAHPSEIIFGGLDEILSPTPTPPPFSPPGITRAPSLAQVAPRPLRRPTMSDEAGPYVPGNDWEQPWSMRKEDKDLEDPNKNIYRVTTLSNHAAEAFAYHTASLVESIILLPLDILFTRSLAWNFVTHRPGRDRAEVMAVTTSGLWPLNMRAHITEFTVMQGLQFVGNVFITTGLQGLTQLTIWTAGSLISLRLGIRYGWGKV